MRKVKLHEITDEPLELVPYRPDIYASSELEYRYKLALYLNSIGVCDSCLFENKCFEDSDLTMCSPIPKLMSLYIISDNCNTEEFYEYLDCYPLSPTCKYLAEAGSCVGGYIVDRFKKGKFNIDSLVEMVKVYGMINTIRNIFRNLTGCILLSNGGNHTAILELGKILGININMFSFIDSIACYGNYEAFVYTTSLIDIDIYTMLCDAYCTSNERLETVVGYYLRSGKTIEYLLTNIDLSAVLLDNDVNMIKVVIEKFNPDLNTILKDAPGDVIDAIEEILENEV